MQAIHKSSIVSVLLTCTALTAGCAASGPISDLDPEAVDAAPMPLALSLAAVPVSAEVSAQGSGCPSGTWSADVSADGETVSLALYAHEASTRSDGSGLSSCAINVRLNSSQGVSYAVNSLSYDGYAELDEDVRGRQSASYHFQGNSAGGAGGQTNLVGPYADEFDFRDDLSQSGLVWSPCGTSRTLSLNTSIRITNGSGDMSVDKIRLRLSQRACQ